MFGHIEGSYSLETARELIARHTRNYAKRQMTWFRKYADMEWINPGDHQKIIDLIG